jgi:uncharacterized protein (TIGR03437 family)
MNRKRKLVIAKIAVVMGTIPLLVWAYGAGPSVGKAGVPGESTCMEAGCHLGTGLNTGGGSVRVTFPGGMTYTPGLKQHLVVTIADATARAWGFQLTARLSTNPRGMAGSFTSTDRFTAVVCGATPTDPGEIFLDFGPNQNCPVNRPLAYMEHTIAGSSRERPLSQTYEFDWTPPSTNVGNIVIYVAGNAANNNQNESGDKIYTASYTLTPAPPASAPAISVTAGVVNGASFAPGVVPNSWMTIRGTNLSPTTTNWDRSIVEGQLPTSLDGVSVTVGGRPAYINYISPTQINALAPSVGAGTMDVTVTNPAGTSPAVTANSLVLMPAFFPWPENGVVATRLDGSSIGKFAGAGPARPDEVVILWGTGFGPTNPQIPVGSVTLPGVPYRVTSTVSVTVGGAPAEFIGAALSNGFVGLYQVAIRIPANAPTGDLGGAQSPSGPIIPVQR